MCVLHMTSSMRLVHEARAIYKTLMIFNKSFTTQQLYSTCHNQDKHDIQRITYHTHMVFNVCVALFD